MFVILYAHFYSKVRNTFLTLHICQSYLYIFMRDIFIDVNVSKIKKSKCLKYGTKSTHFEFFFKSALISAIWTHFEKKIDNQILHGSLYFPLFQRQLLILKTNQSLQMLNVLSTILLIVRSFVKVVKLYRWDKSDMYHANKNNFCIDFVNLF